MKSYIRSAYRRIGVERRSQAVLWATQNGFLPDHKRTIVVPDDGTASGSRTERVLRLQG